MIEVYLWAYGHTREKKTRAGRYFASEDMVAIFLLDFVEWTYGAKNQAGIKNNHVILIESRVEHSFFSNSGCFAYFWLKST
jgi:hypothetical protein